MIRVQRSETGYRCGESHHNARASDAAVEAARVMFDEGMRPTAIVARLRVELGLVVPRKTVEHWVYYTTRNVTPREREERAPSHRTMR